MEKEYKAITAKRSLKVHKKFVRRENYRFASFPEIRLSGRRLNELGFETGKTVVIETTDNKIVISVKYE